MCENVAKIKPMPLPSSRKGVFVWSDYVITVKFNFTTKTPSLNPKTTFLELGNGMGLIFASFSHICLLTGYLLLDFQIALTHSILKLKSILIPLKKIV